MALEAMMYTQDPFSYCPNYTLRPEYGGYPLGLHLEEQGDLCNDKGLYGDNSAERTGGDVHPNTSNPCTAAADAVSGDGQPPAAAGGRRKRRRVKSMKNREEMENQRMIHIAVERNRRKQMNEYLAVLRSIMPPSYSQRGDQASIVGGAINFVKELEQLLQSVETQKKMVNDISHNGDLIKPPQPPFSDFFSFPQYSTRAEGEASAVGAAADIEVTMVESHANLKIQSRKRPKQLLGLVAGLQALRLGVLHLNVTSSGDMVLYTVSVKVSRSNVR